MLMLSSLCDWVLLQPCFEQVELKVKCGNWTQGKWHIAVKRHWCMIAINTTLSSLFFLRSPIIIYLLLAFLHHCHNVCVTAATESKTKDTIILILQQPVWLLLVKKKITASFIFSVNHPHCTIQIATVMKVKAKCLLRFVKSTFYSKCVDILKRVSQLWIVKLSEEAPITTQCHPRVIIVLAGIIGPITAHKMKNPIIINTLKHILIKIWLYDFHAFWCFSNLKLVFPCKEQTQKTQRCPWWKTANKPLDPWLLRFWRRVFSTAHGWRISQNKAKWENISFHFNRITSEEKALVFKTNFSWSCCIFLSISLFVCLYWTEMCLNEVLCIALANNWYWTDNLREPMMRLRSSLC